MLPQDDACLEVDADGAAVIADDVDVVADDRKSGADVDQTLELAAATRAHRLLFSMTGATREGVVISQDAIVRRIARSRSPSR